MRKIILIAAIAVLSTNASAGPSRGLSVASSEDPLATLPTPQKVEALAPAPAVAERPAPPTAAPATADKPAELGKDKPTEQAKPKKKRMTTEARVIYELHRHGIYW